MVKSVLTQDVEVRDCRICGCGDCCLWCVVVDEQGVDDYNCALHHLHASPSPIISTERTNCQHLPAKDGLKLWALSCMSTIYDLSY